MTGTKTTIDGKAGRGAIEWASAIETARERLNTPALDRMIA